MLKLNGSALPQLPIFPCLVNPKSKQMGKLRNSYQSFDAHHLGIGRLRQLDSQLHKNDQEPRGLHTHTHLLRSLLQPDAEIYNLYVLTPYFPSNSKC